MRISDWSSDVCSSDLASLEANLDIVEASRLARLQLQILAEIVALVEQCDRRHPLGHWGRCLRGGRVNSRIALSRLGQLDHLAVLWIAELGRASCRERGCQYV